MLKPIYAKFKGARVQIGGLAIRGGEIYPTFSAYKRIDNVEVTLLAYATPDYREYVALFEIRSDFAHEVYYVDFSLAIEFENMTVCPFSKKDKAGAIAWFHKNQLEVRK